MTIKLFDVFVNNGKETDILLKHLNNLLQAYYVRSTLHRRTSIRVAHKWPWSIPGISIKTHRRQTQIDEFTSMPPIRCSYIVYITQLLYAHLLCIPRCPIVEKVITRR